jgi:flagellar motor switch protein FliN/FliY
MQANPHGQAGETLGTHEDILRTQKQAGMPAAEIESERFGGSRNFDSIMRIPIVVQVVLGSATMPVASLMKLGRGAIVALDHRIGEPVDVVVNGRLIARGEIVVLEEDNSRLGISLTEITGPTANNTAE